ncbi:uncharacterized protein PpBr36_09757 [Pyricularia pennisetigena]|uniref:uncharacterized protein n=1 Tax=Pyricularia pennisetigena TaxID=1578925 RepID=UPI0011543F25|nr:uncharacterized protein PpBr36_09757 [Pyricularia pennisetigena]TLS22268.1 hypothetical protein PpBr36_09757 [Pyricularia pennisetigena]
MASASTTSNTPTTFPRSTYAKLSPHPFLLANLAPTDNSHPPARTNGRAQTESRSVNVNTGSLSHAQGSAVVRCGDTTVICGVRAEILPVSSIPNYRALDEDTAAPVSGAERGRRELKDYDLLVPNIELATGCAPQFLPGVPPTTLAQTLSSRVYSLLHASNLLSVDDLRIIHTPAARSRHDDGDETMEDEVDDNDDKKPETKAFWTLFIDVLFISFDGNPFDVAWTAILAALRDTKLPAAKWDEDREMVLCSRQAPAKQLSVRGFPVACTAAVLRRRRDDPDVAGDQYWVLVDPDRLEEGLCDEFVSVVVDGETGGGITILSLLKFGGTAAGMEFINRLVTVAEARWKEVRGAMR